MLQTRGKILFFLIIPALLAFVCVVLYFMFFFKEDLKISSATNPIVAPYYDDEPTGKTNVISFVNSKDSLSMRYIIGAKNYCFAGYNVHLSQEQIKTFAHYNQIKIKYACENVIAFYVNIKTFEEGVTDSANILTYRQNYQEVYPDKDNQKEEVVLNIGDFGTQGWWVKDNLKNRKLSPKPDWERAKLIGFAHEVVKDRKKPASITIYSIVLVKDNTVFFVVCSAVLVLYFIWALLFIYKFSAKKLVIKFESIQEPEKSNEDSWRAETMRVIGSKYIEPDFNIKDLSKEIGKHEKVISRFLHDELGLSFKQYLNNIRLEEACRLLEESDYSIKEIAYKVGFNNSTHFTRVFKQYKDILPSEYKANREKIEV